MSVIYGKNGGGLLGTLGSLATIGGALIPGMQWLTPLGMGLGMMNGGGAGGGASGVTGINSLADILNGIVCGGWANPAGGNIAKKNPNPMPSNEEIYKNWSRFNTY